MHEKLEKEQLRPCNTCSGIYVGTACDELWLSEEDGRRGGEDGPEPWIDEHTALMTWEGGKTFCGLG